MKTKSLLLLVVAAAMLAMGTGCIFSPDQPPNDIPPRPGTTVPFAGSEDVLMDNFRLAYETMDFNIYRDMLHPDFITLLQASTTSQFPDVGTTLDVSEELRIAERMFSGNALTDPVGNLVPGISNISFDLFQQNGTWADTGPNDVVPNARFALYDVVFLFDRTGDSTLRVQGQIKFFVTSRDSLHNGVDRAYWQMLGQQDLTDSAPGI